MKRSMKNNSIYYVNEQVIKYIYSKEKYKWFEFNRFKFGISFGSGTEYGDRLSICLFGLFINLPFVLEDDYHDEIYLSWGFFYFYRAMHFSWGAKTKIVYMPWDTGSCFYHKVRDEDGNWIEVGNSIYEKGQPVSYDDNRATEIHPYFYKLKSGELQSTTARCYVERRIWAWAIFRPLTKFLPLWMIPFKTDITSLSIEFDSEIGEGTGSWKGGTLGCGYEMNKNESMIDCLSRMQSERKFER